MVGRIWAGVALLALLSQTGEAAAPWYVEKDFAPVRRIALTVRNPLALERLAEPVIIRRADLSDANFDSESVTVVDPDLEGRPAPAPRDIIEYGSLLPGPESNGRQIAFQCDDLDLDGLWDELFFMIDLPAGGEKTIYLYLGYMERARFAHEAHAEVGNYYRRHMPWWESKIIGWKLWYGDTVDMYGRRTPGFSAPFELAEQVSGHASPKEYGNDIFWVEDTFGAGSVCVIETPGDESSIARPRVSPAEGKGPLHDTRFAFETLASGPLRGIIRARTRNWNTEAGHYELDQEFTAYAGKSFTTCRARFVKFEHEDADYEYGIGIRKIMNEYRSEAEGGRVASHGKDIGELWLAAEHLDAQHNRSVPWEAIALVVPERFGPTYGAIEGFGGAHLMRLPANEAHAFEYMLLGGWSEGFTMNDEAEFDEYVRDSAARFNAPVEVRVGEVEEKAG